MRMMRDPVDGLKEENFNTEMWGKIEDFLKKMSAEELKSFLFYLGRFRL